MPLNALIFIPALSVWISGEKLAVTLGWRLYAGILLFTAGFALAVSRMASVIGGLGVDRERLLTNLRGKTAAGRQDSGLLAEPAYILLAESGADDAHEVIRKITIVAEKENLSFAQALVRERETLLCIGKKMAELGLIKDDGDIEKAALTWFEKPEQYRGLAVKKARALATKYRELMK